ncbi:MAG: aspartyl protease family protein [Pseudoxanthomonas sp.]
MPIALYLALAGIGIAAAAPPAPSACGAVGAAREDFAMQVPFEVVDGRIYVHARVNGRGPFKFAVDTGASGLGRADASLVSALGLAIQEKSTANSDGVQVAQADTVRIDSLDVGGLSRRDLQVVVRDYNGGMPPQAAFAGIVAREFFADGLLVIDYPRRILSFSRKLSLSPGQEDVVQYRLPFRVPVSIAGVPTQGNLDTGANVAFVLPQALFEELPATRSLQRAGQGRLANSQVETLRTTLHGPFRIGKASLADVDVRVSARYPELLVGAHALQHFAVLIDQRSRSIALCR